MSSTHPAQIHRLQCRAPGVSLALEPQIPSSQGHLYCNMLQNGHCYGKVQKEAKYLERRLHF